MSAGGGPTPAAPLQRSPPLGDDYQTADHEPVPVIQTLSCSGFGVFGATRIASFLVEMGDKTQIQKAAMAAHCANPIWVVIGMTLGILLADVPALLVGDELANRIPMTQVHSIAAGVFVVLGVAILLGAAAGFGF